MENGNIKIQLGKIARTFFSSMTFRSLKRLFCNLLFIAGAYLLGAAVASSAKPEAQTVYAVCWFLQLIGGIITVLTIPFLLFNAAVDFSIWLGWAEAIVNPDAEIKKEKLPTANKVLEITLISFSIWLVVSIIDTSVVKIFQDYLFYRVVFVLLHVALLLAAFAGVIFIGYRLITKKDHWRSLFSMAFFELVKALLSLFSMKKKVTQIQILTSDYWADVEIISGVIRSYWIEKNFAADQPSAERLKAFVKDERGKKLGEFEVVYGKCCSDCNAEYIVINHTLPAAIGAEIFKNLQNRFGEIYLCQE